jgi:hypothetical protein
VPRCLERIRAAGIELPESLFAKRTIPAEFEIVQTSPVVSRSPEHNAQVPS